jgi:hypothetical protein
MEWAKQALAFVGEIDPAQWWSELVYWCTLIANAPAFRFACLILLVLCTIWVIAKVYSGDLQNAERGPIAIRRHSGVSIPADTLIVPRSVIPLTMDGVQARCTFIYVYDGHRGKRQHVKLMTRTMRLSVSPSNLRALTDMAQGNEVPDVGTEEVFWPTLDLDTETPIEGLATPERAKEYAVAQKILERWSGDDSLQLVSLHDQVMRDVRDAREEFIQQRVQDLRDTRSKNWLKRLGHGGAAKRRPGAVGNYYLKFQFSNDPVFVLTKHPDRDVRMTAWLTVLTSLFAIAMELIPIRVDQNDQRARSAPMAEDTQTPIRPRPRVIRH